VHLLFVNSLDGIKQRSNPCEMSSAHSAFTHDIRWKSTTHLFLSIILGKGIKSKKPINGDFTGNKKGSGN